ncbi:MAG: MBL fold metallo-hydrolase [Archangium gephyra]|uniref:MBL fold metallo-hydrolase n=1 Tax=Archangium gephyra TaxID=48 RepID=A0A2W5SXG0_9BACT|nr:MAG: MBL fold metallo-hydrolase [Archangium gephyra]
MKTLALVVVALLIIAVPSYWYLTARNGEPAGTFDLDLTELRRLANEQPGEKPTEVRAEFIATLQFPERAILAGSSWEPRNLDVYAFQARYADGSFGLIDTGMDEAAAKAEGATFFDAEAFERVSAAMEPARFIVVTHEHYDHMGGVVVHPKVKSLRFLVTPQQLQVPGNLEPVKLGEVPDEKLVYEKGAAIAPGVVVWRAAGHTVGHQIIFVQRADGEEFLFLGDVAWYRENYRQVRERATLATLIMGEDRGAVLAQLAAVKALSEANPKLHVVPGHDPDVYKEAFTGGWLVRGF